MSHSEPTPTNTGLPPHCLRLPEESPQAYAAFRRYRDLGLTRSMNKAWIGGQQGGNKKATKSAQFRGTRAPGFWTRWSARFHWKSRADAWDQYWEQTDLRARSAEHARQGIAWAAERQADMEDRLAAFRALRRRLVEQAASGHTQTRRKTATRQPGGGAWHTTEQKSRLLDQFHLLEELRRNLFPPPPEL